MKVLEGSGLINTEKVGRLRTCALNRQNLAAAEKWFGEQRVVWHNRYENLDGLLLILSGEEDEN